MDTKTCTSLSWNYDSSLLALVIDKRQIYLWELQTNQFTSFKPESRSSNYSASKPAKFGNIEVVAWSRVTNKLAIGYSTGKLLLCNFTTPDITETLVENSDGVLERVVSIESSKHLDLFVCITTISEVLVMSYDGHTKFYIQIEHVHVKKAKLSDPMTDTTSFDTSLPRGSAEKCIWLACLLSDSRLLMKRIILSGVQMDQLKTNSDMDIAYNENHLDESSGKRVLINFHWLESTYLVACFSTGLVMLLHIRGRKTSGQTSTSYILKISEALNLAAQEHNGTDTSSAAEKDVDPDNEFKSFELMSFEAQKRGEQSTVGSFSIIASTNYRLFYYELFRLESGETTYAFEKVDDLDLTGGLKSKGLRLYRVEWSFDCSMLAIQLTNAHILVYRTRLQNYLVTLNGPKAAYLSGTKEVTILDYGLTRPCRTDETDSGEEELMTGTSNNKALTVVLDLRPSVIAVGPKHLTIALNNHVWFYQIASSKLCNLNNEASLIDEQEYGSVVLELQLSSRFVAVLFNNGRLKLHAIQFRKQANKTPPQSGQAQDQPDMKKHDYFGQEEDVNERDFLDDERFFPDPSKLDEQITAFALTEELFVYCTRDCHLNVFSLKNWTLTQSCDYSGIFSNDDPIQRLLKNERGNKFVCLARESKTLNNVYLYDLYSNKMVKFFSGSLYARIFKSQLALPLGDYQELMQPDELFPVEPKLNRITDAIWDNNGRTVHLFSGKSIYSAVVLNHTLESEKEEMVIEYAATVCKPLSYKALYASDGVVSFQTSLGRVINLILESHDDESRLVRLKSDMGSKLSENRDSITTQMQVMQKKMSYFRFILSIHSLSKCREIAEYLMSEEFEQPSTGKRLVTIDQVLWKQLAARALFTMDLTFALAVYRRSGLLVFAQVLDDILCDSRKRTSDSKRTIRTRLLVMLDCEMVDEGYDHV